MKRNILRLAALAIVAASLAGCAGYVRVGAEVPVSGGVYVGPAYGPAYGPGYYHRRPVHCDYYGHCW